MNYRKFTRGLSFLYYYIGSFSFLAYLLPLLKLHKFKSSRSDWFVFLCLTGLFNIAAMEYGVVDALVSFRFHWGFIIFFIFLKTFGIENFSNRFLWILLIFTFAEWIFINFTPLINYFPSYTADHIERLTKSDSLIRANGFGGNSSVTSVLLVVILANVTASSLLKLSLLAVLIIVGSGSGVLAYVFYLIASWRKLFSIRLKKYRTLIRVLLAAFILCLFAFSSTAWDLIFNVLYRLSYSYLQLLFDLKVDAFFDYYNSASFFEFLFGNPKSSFFSGDFLWLSFLSCHGFCCHSNILSKQCDINRRNNEVFGQPLRRPHTVISATAHRTTKISTKHQKFWCCLYIRLTSSDFLESRALVCVGDTYDGDPLEKTGAGSGLASSN